MGGGAIASPVPSPPGSAGPVGDRGVVPGVAGGAMAPPDFGRSVNLISSRGDKLCPPNYYWHPRIFRPSDGPGRMYPIDFSRITATHIPVRIYLTSYVGAGILLSVLNSTFGWFGSTNSPKTLDSTQK